MRLALPLVLLALAGCNDPVSRVAASIAAHYFWAGVAVEGSDGKAVAE